MSNPQNSNRTMEIATTLRSLLATNIVRFTFMKKDGTTRIAIGTRNLTTARKVSGVDIPTPTGRPNPNAYWDFDRQAWRSFCPDNLVSIDGVYESLAGVDEDETPAPAPEPKAEVKVDMPTHYPDDPLNLRELFGGIGIGKMSETPAGLKPYPCPENLSKLLGILFGGLFPEMETAPDKKADLDKAISDLESVRDDLANVFVRLDTALDDLITSLRG